MMLQSWFCYCICLGLAVASQHEADSSTEYPQAQQQPAILHPSPKPTAPRSSTTIPIVRTAGKSHGKESTFDWLRELFFGSKKEAGQDSSQLSANVNLTGASYIAHVTIGTQVLPLLIDTGSSDLWVATSTFQCLDKDDGNKSTDSYQSQQQEAGQGGDNTKEENKCTFPATYANSIPPGGFVPDEYFSIRYGNGQFLYGKYGIDSVSLGGITVSDQRIALPEAGYFQSSTGDFAGIIGLAHPAMVAARKGSEPRKPPPPAMVIGGGDGDDGGEAETKQENDSDGHKEEEDVEEFAEYDTWFFRAVKQGLTKSLFSLALDIDGGGMLGIGEVVDVGTVGEFVSTPILKVNLVNEARAAHNFTFYTIMADDYILNGTPFSQLQAEAQHEADGSHTAPIGSLPPTAPSFPVVVDSGWTTNVLPPSLVTAFYKTFPETHQPQLVEIDGETLFAAPCDLTPLPSFGVQIGKEIVLEMHPESVLVSRLNTTVTAAAAAAVVVVDGGRPEPVRLCALGIQPGVELAGVLGDTFLSSVVAVFDVREGGMRFAQRARGGLGGDGEKGKDEL